MRSFNFIISKMLSGCINPSFLGVLVLSFLCVPTLPSFAQGSGYYETPAYGRPPSVFSLCCCKKDNLNSSSVRAFYTCEYIEDVKCPEGNRPYNVPGFECPNSLMFTKFVPEET